MRVNISELWVVMPEHNIAAVNIESEFFFDEKEAREVAAEWNSAEAPHITWIAVPLTTAIEEWNREEVSSAGDQG